VQERVLVLVLALVPARRQGLVELLRLLELLPRVHRHP